MENAVRCLVIVEVFSVSNNQNHRNTQTGQRTEYYRVTTLKINSPNTCWPYGKFLGWVAFLRSGATAAGMITKIRGNSGARQTRRECVFNSFILSVLSTRYFFLYFIFVTAIQYNRAVNSKHFFWCCCLLPAMRQSAFCADARIFVSIRNCQRHVDKTVFDTSNFCNIPLNKRFKSALPVYR